MAIDLLNRNCFQELVDYQLVAQIKDIFLLDDEEITKKLKELEEIKNEAQA